MHETRGIKRIITKENLFCNHNHAERWNVIIIFILRANDLLYVELSRSLNEKMWMLERKVNEWITEQRNKKNYEFLVMNS